MRRPLTAILLAVASVATAQYPTVVSIRFEGNDTTHEEVFRRELAVAVGEPADPEAIEASRQSILDLALFRSVEVRSDPVPGGVELVFEVREKRYILPIPRLGANSDGERTYGAQLRLYNLWGLDHGAKAYIEKGDFANDRLRESEKAALLTYTAPYVIGQFGLSGTVGYIDRVAPTAGGTFDETIEHAAVTVFRDYRETRPRTGWVLAGGLSWLKQDAFGPLAPPADGTATAFNFEATWDDVRFRKYSEFGRRFSVRVEAAVDGFMSDYGYRRLQVRHEELIALDDEHHTLNLIAEARLNFGGPGRINAFSLGGADNLRGYDADYIEGERYLYTAAEYLRPLGPRWLRLLVVAETGATDGNISGARSGGPYSSIGVGLRIRLTWFVNSEIEIGLAWPLRGGDGMQVFASGD